jgi:hypothetical protein
MSNIASTTGLSPAEDHVTPDDCRDLLLGLLTGTEREHILGHLRSCGSCSRVFQEHAAEMERFRVRGVVDGVLATEGQREGNPVVGERKSPIARRSHSGRRPGARGRPWRLPTFGPRLRLGIGLAAAAAVALLLSLWPTGGTDESSERIFWLPRQEAALAFRSQPDEPADRNMTEALEAYATQDVDRAGRLLQAFETTGKAEILRRVYLGNVLAQQGAYSAAVEVLKSIPMAEVPPPWSDESRWTLYVCLRALHLDDQADALLGELAQEPGQVGDRARLVRGSEAGH